MSTHTVKGWLRAAVEDAERRGLPELKPLLEALARSTTSLRAADTEARHELDQHEAANVRDEEPR